MYPRDHWRSPVGQGHQRHGHHSSTPHNNSPHEEQGFNYQGHGRRVLLDLPLFRQHQDFATDQNFMRQPAHALRPQQRFGGNQGIRPQQQGWQSQGTRSVTNLGQPRHMAFQGQGKASNVHLNQQGFMPNQGPRSLLNLGHQRFMSNQSQRSPSTLGRPRFMSNQGPRSPLNLGQPRFMSDKGPRSPSNLGQPRFMSNQGPRSPSNLGQPRFMTNQGPRKSSYHSPQSSRSASKFGGQRFMSNQGQKVTSTKFIRSTKSGSVTNYKGHPSGERDITYIQINIDDKNLSKLATESSTCNTKASSEKLNKLSELDNRDYKTSEAQTHLKEITFATKEEVTLETNLSSNNAENSNVEQFVPTETSEKGGADLNDSNEETKSNSVEAVSSDDLTNTDLEKTVKPVSQDPITTTEMSHETLITDDNANTLPKVHEQKATTNGETEQQGEFERNTIEAVDEMKKGVLKGSEGLDKVSELEESMKTVLKVGSVQDNAVANADKKGETLDETKSENKYVREELVPEHVVEQVENMNISEKKCDKNGGSEIEIDEPEVADIEINNSYHNLSNEGRAEAKSAETEESRTKTCSESGSARKDDVTDLVTDSMKADELAVKFNLEPVGAFLDMLDKCDEPTVGVGAGNSAKRDQDSENAMGGDFDDVAEDHDVKQSTLSRSVEKTAPSSEGEQSVGAGKETVVNRPENNDNEVSKLDKNEEKEMENCSEVKEDIVEGDMNVSTGNPPHTVGVESVEDKTVSKPAKQVRDTDHAQATLDAKENISPDKIFIDKKPPKERQSPTSFLEFVDDMDEDDESDDDMLGTAPAFLKSIEELTGRPLQTTPEKSVCDTSQSSSVSDIHDTSMEYHSPLDPRRRPQTQSKSKFTLDNLLADHMNTFEHEKEMDEIKSELKAGIQQGGFVNILNREEESTGDISLPEKHQEVLRQFHVEESHICDHRPGSTIFNSQQYLCLFDSTIRPSDCGFSVTGNTHLEKHLANVVPAQYLRLLTTSVVPLLFSKLPCQVAVLKWLFFLQSVEENNQTCDGCRTVLQEILHKNHKTVKCFPDVYDLLTVLVNYGADLETLVPSDLISLEIVRSKLYHQPQYQRPVAHGEGDGVQVRGYQKNNLFMELEFMALSLYRNSVTMTAEELDLLLVVLGKASLDASFKNSCGVDAFHNCVAMAVKQYTDTDWEIHRLKVSRLLSNISDHHHNMASIAELLPQTGARDMYLQRTVGYIMLSKILLDDNSGMDKDLANIQIRHLHQFVGPMKELLINDPYKLSSVITILDICVGINITLRSSEREELKTLIELVHSIRVRDNVSMLDRTRVKDMMVRLTSSWSLDIQTMKGKQTKIFEYAVHDSPVRMKIETVETSQMNEDSASDSQSDEDEMPCKMQKLLPSNEEVT